MQLSAGAQYGIMGAVAYAVASHFGPKPVAGLLAVVALDLAWGAILLWRRTGLTFGAFALGLGAANLALVAAFGWSGHPFPDLPWHWLIFLGVSAFVGSICMRVLEPRLHPDEWAAWDAAQTGKSGFDVLLGRHIPDLRRPRQLP